MGTESDTARIRASLAAAAEPPQPPAALARGFTVTELSDTEWRVDCRHCAKAWGLKKTSTPGNLLHLLNHERGHLARGGSR